MACRCYCKFLARYPLAVVLMVFLILCIALTGTFVRSPKTWLAPKDKGMTAVGTVIHNALLAFKQLTQEIQKGKLSYKPFPRDENGEVVRVRYEPLRRLNNGTLSTMMDWVNKCKPWLPIGNDHVKIVISLPKDSMEKNLNVDFMRALCELEDNLIMTYPGINTTCPPLSLGRYLGLIVNKSCRSLRYGDIADAKKVLFDCAPYYNDGRILSDCYQDPQRCPLVPQRCLQYNSVFNIFTYLVNSNFMDPIAKGDYGKMTLLHLPISKRDMFLASDFVRDVIEVHKLKLDYGDVVSVDTGENYVIMLEMGELDLIQSSVILVILVIIIWFYLGSLLLLLTIILSLVVTVIISYFLYTTILNIDAFPPINLLACVLFLMHCIIDVLLMADLWMEIEDRKPNVRLGERVEYLFDRALFPLITSHLVSASATFANVLSKIELISGLAVFTSIGLLLQLCMKLSLVPAVLVLNEYGVRSMIVPCCSDKMMSCMSRSADAGNTQPSGFKKFRKRLRQNFSQLNKVLLLRMIPKMVIKGRFFWSVIFTSLGIFGLVWTYENTRLRPTVLPTEMRLYHSGTLLGNYHDLQTHFRSYAYDENNKGDLRDNPMNMTVNLVFGLIPKENNKLLSLQHTVALEPDSSFDFYHPKTVAWLQNYCEILGQQNQLLGDHDLVRPCLLNYFAEVLSRPCNHETTGNCCNKPVGHFPYNREVISLCLTTMLARNDTYRPHSFLGRPIFNQSNHVVAFVYDFTTKYRLTSETKQEESNTDKNVFQAYAELKEFVLSSFQGAPTGLDTAWVFSQLSYLDLTTTITEEMPLMLMILLSIVTLTIFICSLHIMFTLYYALTLTFTTCIISGSLSFLQWQIGILELVMLCMIVPLSSTFSLHYLSAYRSTTCTDRKLKCKIAYETTASSTFITVLVLLLIASVLYSSRLYPCYILGQFVFVFTLTSWIYATFFLPSILSWIGPTDKNCCKSCICRCCKPVQDDPSPEWNENGTIDPLDHYQSSNASPAIATITSHSTSKSGGFCAAFKKKRYRKVSLKNNPNDEQLMYQVTSL